jgi:hypothetical protein
MFLATPKAIVIESARRVHDRAASGTSNAFLEKRDRACTNFWRMSKSSGELIGYRRLS